VDTLWTAIAAIAATVQAVVVVVAAIYALGQVREARRARYLNMLQFLTSAMDTESAHQDRVRLFEELIDEDLTQPVSQEHYDLIYRIARLFNFIGDLLDNKLLDIKLIAESHGRPISRIWQLVEPWVQTQREKNQDPQFARAFEHLGNTCMEWDKATHGEKNMARPYKRTESQLAPTPPHSASLPQAGS
jgi:hypothetical protein